MYTGKKNETKPVGRYRPNLCFYHANPKGTGSAAQMNLHPAHDDMDGCIMLTMANQMTVGNRLGPEPTFSRFDWENAMTVKLDFSDLTQILQVLRGECESLGEGKGLYHLSARGSAIIRLSHLVDPVVGYMLDISRKPVGGGDVENRARMLLSPAEALGLCETIAGSLYLISFGIPMLLPHETAIYRAETREAFDASAA